jgi:hypothetical protein
MYFHNFSTNFDHGHLNDEGHNHDDVEPTILKHSTEDVPFILLKLSGVNLVENLHEYKDLEHISEMKGFLSIATVCLIPREENLALIFELRPPGIDGPFFIGIVSQGSCITVLGCFVIFISVSRVKERSHHISNFLISLFVVGWSLEAVGRGVIQAMALISGLLSFNEVVVISVRPSGFS